jgi:hypothetical protein
VELRIPGKGRSHGEGIGKWAFFAGGVLIAGLRCIPGWCIRRLFTDFIHCYHRHGVFTVCLHALRSHRCKSRSARS